MKKLFLTMALAIATVVGVGAQTKTETTFNDKSDFYVGYQFVRLNPNVRQPNFRFTKDTDSHGVNGSYTYFFGNKSVGLTNELATSFSSDTSVTTGMTGVTLKSRKSKVQPFARALVGFAHVRADNEFANTGFKGTNTSLAFAVGGGLDVKLTEKVQLRLIQADYLQTRAFHSTQRNLRLGIGLVF